MFAGRTKCSRGPHAARGPHFAHPCFRGSEEVLGSPHNGNFLGIFELLARRDPILKELQDRIKNKNTKDHYLSPTIQNELIELLATEVEKENLQQLKLAKYFSIILDCTPDM